MQSRKRSPRFVKRYFWEVDLEKVRLPRHRTYVIERILERGDDRAISPNTANPWALALDIPREEITCFSTPSLLRHGPFSRG